MRVRCWLVLLLLPLPLTRRSNCTAAAPFSMISAMSGSSPTMSAPAHTWWHARRAHGAHARHGCTTPHAWRTHATHAPAHTRARPCPSAALGPPWRRAPSSSPLPPSPAALASSASASFANTATRSRLPVPCGSSAMPRTTCGRRGWLGARGRLRGERASVHIRGEFESRIVATMWARTGPARPPGPPCAGQQPTAGSAPPAAQQRTRGGAWHAGPMCVCHGAASPTQARAHAPRWHAGPM